MSFTKVTPQNSPKQRSLNLKSGYSFPMRTRLVVECPYENDLAPEAEQELTEPSQHRCQLHMDGLCQNTVENLGNTTDVKEKLEARQRRAVSCSAVLMFLVCVVSLISLVLTLLMLTGNVSTRCSCPVFKDGTLKKIQSPGFSQQKPENGFERWVKGALRNLTAKMDKQSRDYHKMKDDFNMMNEDRINNEKELQETLKDTKAKVDSKMRKNEAAIAQVSLSLEKLNNTYERISNEIDKLWQDLGDAKKSFTLKPLEVSVFYKNLTRLQNQVLEECTTNHSKIQAKLEKAEMSSVSMMKKLSDIADKANKRMNMIEKEFHGAKNTMNEMDSKVKKLQTKLNETAEAFQTTANRQQEQLKRLNFTKEEVNSTLQKILPSLLHMKTYLTKQVNDTKKSLEVSKSMLQNSMKNLNQTLLNKIQNMTTSPNTRYNGSGGVPRPSVNVANFSQCQYKFAASPGATKTGTVSVDIAVREPKGTRIIGSTCSTNAAAEYNLVAVNTTDASIYRCVCRGASSVFAPLGDKIYCYIHYWECPFVD